MNLLSSLNFLRRSAPQAMPEHVKVRYVVAAKSDNTKLARKRAKVEAELRAFVTQERLRRAVIAQQEYRDVEHTLFVADKGGRG